MGPILSCTVLSADDSSEVRADEVKYDGYRSFQSSSPRHKFQKLEKSHFVRQKLLSENTLHGATVLVTWCRTTFLAIPEEILSAFR